MNKQVFSLLALRDELHDIAITTFAPSGIKLDFKSEIKLDLKLEAQLYRDIKLCIYELTNNILKHAETTHCKMEISASNSILRIIIEDYGCLKDIEKIENKGNGINNLRKRVERNAGTLNLSISSSGNGLISLLSFKLKS
jgi:signal transduction histidine kinase